MNIEKRRFIRHPLCYPIKTKIFNSEGKDEYFARESDDIGAGGLLFRYDRKIPEKSDVEINLEVEGRRFLLDGRVVRCEGYDGGQYRIAVAFNKPDELLKVRMMEQVVRIEVIKNRIEKRFGVKLDFATLAKEWIKRYSRIFKAHYDI